jgi:F-type H+-transporting ATPase subunit a
MRSPLEQFTVTPILYIFSFFEFFGINLTNFSVFCLVFTLVCSSIALFCVFSGKILPSTRQYIIEAVFEFVLNMVQSNLKAKQQRYLPLFFFIFCFILFVNLFGLFPYGFTLSSQIVFACILSFSAFLGLILIGIKNYKINFFALFFPSEAPVFLAVLLVPIEIVSFFSRPFSLAIRLFANMTAGHVLLKILAGFVVLVFSSLFGLLFDSNLFFSIFGIKGVSHVSLNLFDHTYLAYSLNKTDLFFVCMSTRVGGQLQSISTLFYCFMDLVAHPFLFHDFCGTFPFDMDIVLTLFIGDFTLATDEYVSFFLQFGDKLFWEDLAPFFVFADNQVFGHPLNPCVHLPAVSFNLDLCVNLFFILSNLIFDIFVVFLFIIVLTLFVVLEIFVAVLQAYVFSILLVIYLRDMYELH